MQGKVHKAAKFRLSQIPAVPHGRRRPARHPNTEISQANRRGGPKRPTNQLPGGRGATWQPRGGRPTRPLGRPTPPSGRPTWPVGLPAIGAKIRRWRAAGRLLPPFFWRQDPLQGPINRGVTPPHLDTHQGALSLTL